jgi:hypothetical protein
VWPIALGSLFASSGYVVYTLVATPFMLVDAHAVTAIRVPSFVPWLAVLSWFVLEIALATRKPASGD